MSSHDLTSNIFDLPLGDEVGLPPPNVLNSPLNDKIYLSCCPFKSFKTFSYLCLILKPSK